ncbi:MAG: FGGY family carbohydrate kinase [Bacteroidota bacterium]
MTYRIGLDVGTTATKACAFNAAGEQIGMEERGYELLHPAAGAAVQRPMDILWAAEEALAALVKSLGTPPLSVGLSCAMHSLILCDEYEAPLDVVYTWADTRPQAVMGEIGEAERYELHRLTGTPVHPMSPLVKLRWLLREQPHLREEAIYCYDLKSFLTKYWTNTAMLDEQLASATGLYHAKEGVWSQRALTVANGDHPEPFPFLLPPVRPITERLAWDNGVAQRLGLTGVPLYLGGSDGVLANLGSGLLKPGDVALSIGTSGALRTTHQQPYIDPKHGLFNYKMKDDLYVVGGPTNNGGKVLAYWQDLLKGHFPDIASFIDGAFSVPAAEAPVFQPWLFGERAPIWDAAATAALAHLVGHHTPAHLARAVLEGVTGNIVHILHQLEEVVGPANRILASGGFTQSPAWVQLIAERSGREVVVVEAGQATAYGAVLAGVEGERG